MKRVLPVIFLGLWSCATENRALQLRTRARADRASWAEAWEKAQGEGNLELRFRLAHRYFRGEATDATVGPDEVRRVLAADVRSVLVLDGISVEIFRQSIEWADREMKDTALTASLQCRAAQVFPAEAQWTMACAQKSEWSKARPLLAQALARGLGDACEIVFEFERRSPDPDGELAAFPPETIRRCRVARPVAASERKVEQATPSSPHTLGETVSSGLQLNAELLGTPQGVGLSTGIGWANERIGLGVSPSFSLSVATEGPISVETGAVGVAAWGRLWFFERRSGELNGFAHVELGLGGAWRTTTAQGTAIADSPFQPGLIGNALLGGEYLFSPRVGATAGLGLRWVTAPALTVGAFGSLGIVLHH